MYRYLVYALVFAVSVSGFGLAVYWWDSPAWHSITAAIWGTRVAAIEGQQNRQDGPFQQVNRRGSVDLAREYNLSGLSIPRRQIHTLLPRDAIPSLTDPHTLPSKETQWLDDHARVVVVQVEGPMESQVLGVPLRVLDWHEIVNTTLGGLPIAVTYCPLCDSATVFSRRLPNDATDGAAEPTVLEFGVSGALFNSNVLMYDRQEKGLWSQLGMKAVSGPRVGTALTMLPVDLITLEQMKAKYPDAPVVSNRTGHDRKYTGPSPYSDFFAHEGLMVPVAQLGNALPRKTLGVGIAHGEQSWFVPLEALEEEISLQTPAGRVRLGKSPAGVRVLEQPPEVQTAQTFYYSWSAFYPATEILRGQQ